MHHLDRERESRPPIDSCPTCGGESVARCRCLLNGRACAEGHEWHVCRKHDRIALGSGHGADDGSGCTCTAKETP